MEAEPQTDTGSIGNVQYSPAVGSAIGIAVSVSYGGEQKWTQHLQDLLYWIERKLSWFIVPKIVSECQMAGLSMFYKHLPRRRVKKQLYILLW